jgi:hypothetical protein
MRSAAMADMTHDKKKRAIFTFKAEAAYGQRGSRVEREERGQPRPQERTRRFLNSQAT